jgi:hypothetical protein
MFDAFEEKRIRRIIQQYLGEYDLDLRGLCVYTEAASGYYLITPILCLMAGAKKVYAVTKDSVWGRAEEIKYSTYDMVERWGLEKSVEVVFEKKSAHVAECDIITNLGFVRPIDSKLISWMKETAVIPLMWETWEFRPDEVDMAACKEKGILVLGTDEHEIHFIDYAGYLSWKLLLDSRIEIFKNRIFVISSNPVARVINRLFHNNGVEFRWTSFHADVEDEFKAYHIDRHDKESILAYISRCDAIVCDEKFFDMPIVSSDGILTPEELKETNDSILFVFRSGVIDYERMKELGIAIYPDKHVPFGYSTTCSCSLGPRPVIELHAAGLKVGETMARARLGGMDPASAAKHALEHSPAMDFADQFSWA